MTTYRKLTVEDVDSIIRSAGLEWQNIGIHAADTTVGVATLRNLPVKAANHQEIKNYSGWVGGQLQAVGAIAVLYQVPENRVFFKVPEPDHA